MEKKTLVIVEDTKRYFFPLLKRDNIILTQGNAESANCSILKDIINCLKNKSKNKLLSENLNEKYNKIIVFDNVYCYSLIHYIRKNGYKGIIYIFNWNPVLNIRKKVFRIIFKPFKVRIYSFDLSDCRRYHLHHNSTLYCREVVPYPSKIRQDIFFLGMEKDRLNRLSECYKTFIKYNLQVKFYVVGKGKAAFPLYNETISYSAYLNEIEKSRSILDIAQDGQQGLSMRVMEALFLKRKLITDNPEVEKADFYNNNNIFILGKRPLAELNGFISSPYKPIDREIIERYDIDNWIKRFK